MHNLDALRWENLWQRLGGTAPTGSFKLLQDAYSNAQRHYHNSSHVIACLTHLDQWIELAEQPAQVELALWTHDLVYDTQRQDNEAASAACTLDWLAQAGLPEHQQAVAALILATCHKADAHAGDQALIADIDLAILASSPTDYACYQAAVRKEYAWVPEPLFKAGRMRLLEEWLAQPALYQVAELRQLWEVQARENLSREWSMWQIRQ